MNACLEIANRFLSHFCTIKLYYRDNKLRMRWPRWKQEGYHDYPASLQASGLWPRFGYNQRPCGGTTLQVLAQLILWLRGRPHLPLYCLERQFGEEVKVGPEGALELLRASDYEAGTECIYCGKRPFQGGLDWFSLGRKTGPGCKQACCETHPYFKMG